MENNSKMLNFEKTFIKKELNSDFDGSDDEELAQFLNNINDSTENSAHDHTTLEPIRVDPSTMSENAINLIRTIEERLSSKTESLAVAKVENEVLFDENNVEMENTLGNDGCEINFPDSEMNAVIDPFTGNKVASVPKYIFVAKPPNKPGLFDCNKCGLNMRSESCLYDHNMSQHVNKKHILNKPFICDICDRSFADTSGLSQHRDTKHKILNPLYKPTNCAPDNPVKKKCTNPDTWLPDSSFGDGNHGYDESGSSGVQPRFIFGPVPPENEGLFSCRKCSKNLTSQENLDKHNLVRHLNQIFDPKKPHVCNICDKPFKTVKKMMYHKIHLHKMSNPLYIPYKQRMGLSKQKMKNKTFQQKQICAGPAQIKRIQML